MDRRGTAPAAHWSPSLPVTSSAAAPLNSSPEFTYPAPSDGPPPWDRCRAPPGHPTSHTLRRRSGGGLADSGSSARKCFPQKSNPRRAGGQVGLAYPAATHLSNEPAAHPPTQPTCGRPGTRTSPSPSPPSPSPAMSHRLTLYPSSGAAFAPVRVLWWLDSPPQDR